MGQDLRDKIAGVVFGTAIGDALGFPVEFMKRVEILQKYPPNGIDDFVVTQANLHATDLRDMVGRNQAARDSNYRYFAPYSDDTQMMRAVLDGLLRARPLMVKDIDKAAEEVAEEFIAWQGSLENNRSPGASCTHGCINLRNGMRWDLAGKEDGKGCGTAMRSMAYGIYFHDSPILASEFAAAHAKMTHRTREAQAAAAAVAAGVAAGIRGEEPGDMLTSAVAAAYHWDQRYTGPLLRQIGKIILAEPPEKVLAQWQGWRGGEAVAAAFYCFLRHRDDYKGAVLEAVNSDGDSDSVGAIVGALSGSHLGLQALPVNWVARVEKSDQLGEYADQVLQARERAA